jgi:uncharacterized alkaline shock family protein YloU
VNTYFYVGNDGRGKLGISVFVFQQIAEDTVKSLVNEGELKYSVVYQFGNKSTKVKATIEKGIVHVDISIIGIRGSDLQTSCSMLQKAVYENIYDITEISALKVNVSVLSIIDKDEGK